MAGKVTCFGLWDCRVFNPSLGGHCLEGFRGVSGT